MNLLYGEIFTPILILVTILWDWKQRNFRGIVLQSLCALCAGTVLNAIVNLRLHPNSAIKTLILYLILMVGFYLWAAYNRKSKPLNDKEV